MKTVMVFLIRHGFNRRIAIRVSMLMMLLSSHVKSMFTSVLFNKSPLQGTFLYVYTTQRNAESFSKCSIVCERRSPPCEAFGLNSLDRTCQLYTTGTTQITSSTIEVFRFQDTDIFHAISIGDRRFSIYRPSVYKSYDSARSHCHKLGAYLIEFNSPEEYKAVELLLSETYGGYSFVGFNDIAVEGQWMTDKDNTPARPEDLVWWFAPDNDGNEDCAAFIHFSPYVLGDVSCSVPGPFVCEREVP